jgi:RNA polymerase sigma-70 factor (ECF subfamily)
MGRLLEALLAGRAGADDPGLEARLAAQIDEARKAWPGLAVDDEAVARYVGLRLAPGTPPVEALAALAVPDLSLACAVARGEPQAIELCDRKLLGPAVEASARRIAGTGPFVDEAHQLLAARLFLARPDGTRGIERYGGRGSLFSWLRVGATRQLLKLRDRRGRKEAPLPDALLDVLGAHGDPELDLLRRRYQAEVRGAFEAAAAALPERDRTLLHYQLIEGLGSERIAPIYGVHRATVSRWLVQAKERLIAEMRRALAERLATSESEADSVLRLVQSGLELSLNRILAR